MIARVRRIATAQRADTVLIPDSVRAKSLGPEPVLRECAGGGAVPGRPSIASDRRAVARCARLAVSPRDEAAGLDVLGMDGSAARVDAQPSGACRKRLMQSS